MRVRLFPANWAKHGRSAGMIRNDEIAKYADRCVAFWDGESRGTSDVIARFERLGKPVEVRRP